jgi:tetratricopeptide (TPR) repeat protein
MLRVLVFLLALGLGPTWAYADAFDDCYQPFDPDLLIKGCSKLIDEGELSQIELSMAYYNRGSAYDDMGQYDRAIADYDQAIKLVGKDAFAHNKRGLAHQKRGNYDQAIADFTMAIELKPTDADFYNGRAWAYFKWGKAAKGLPDANKALELVRENADAYGTRGQIYEALGRKDEAIADYRKAIELDPSNDKRKEPLSRLGVTP